MSEVSPDNKKMKLTRQLIISVISIMFFMVLVMGGVVAQILYKSNQDRLNWEKESNLRVATSLLAEPIWILDNNIIRNVAASFIREENQIMAVRVFDEYNEILEEVKDSSIETSIYDYTQKCRKCFINSGDIVKNDTTIGRVEFVYSTEKFERELISLFLTLTFSILVVGGLFSYAILLRLRNTIAFPIKRIVESSKRLTEGNYKFKVADENVREFQEIVDAQNIAIQSIYERELELKMQIAKAEQATEAKSNFVSTMSHEIRTPLNAIIGLSELVLDTELSEYQKESLQTLKMSADSLLSIINDILDFSKIEAGKLELENRPFNLHQLINNAHKMLEVTADQKDIMLKMSIAPDVKENYSGDYYRLKQVFLNLIQNAIKFTPNNGKVFFYITLVDSYREFDYLRIEVQDTGIGIAADRMDRLFDSFRQVDQSTTRKFGGTGLGLSISKKLIDLMNGKISVESEVNVGSTFIVELNLKRVER